MLLFSLSKGNFSGQLLQNGRRRLQYKACSSSRRLRTVNEQRVEQRTGLVPGQMNNPEAFKFNQTLNLSNFLRSYATYEGFSLRFYVASHGRLLRSGLCLSTFDALSARHRHLPSLG